MFKTFQLRKWLWATSLLALALMFHSPSNAESYLSEENRPNKTVDATPIAQIKDTAWQLALMNVDTKSVRPDSPSSYTLQLDANGTVAVQADCNRGTGTWQSNGDGQIQFGPMAVTKALCPPNSLHDPYLENLGAVSGYHINDGQLILSSASGDLMIMTRLQGGSAMQIPKSPDEGGPLSWQFKKTTQKLNLYQKPSQFAPILEVLDPNLRLTNLGCQIAEDEVWCDVQPLGGGARGYIQAKLLEPALSSNGAVVYGPDNSALRAGQGDFDATGNVPCAQFTGQPMGQCPFGVARSGGGYATLVITLPEGRQRIIFFSDGTAIGSSFAQADKTGPFSAYKEADLYFIKVGDERYEVPEVVIFGD